MSGTGEALREAVISPVIFLTVALAGGFRAGAAGISLLPPPLISLVLALLLIGVLIRAGVLSTRRVMSANRTPLENVSGAVLLAVLFFASAQLFNTLTPEAGLLHFVFNVFFIALLWTTLAAEPDARRLLRSLLVIFGLAFILKYVVLASLYDPRGSLSKRVLTTLLEGVTLGSLQYEPYAPLTGYVAFFTILVYMVGLALLPRPIRTPPAVLRRRLEAERARPTIRDTAVEGKAIKADE